VETPHPFAICRIPPQASMGPRFCKRGNIRGADDVAVLDAASMGPRFCKRGNLPDLEHATTRKIKLQWGHAFVSVETGHGSIIARGQG